MTFEMPTKRELAFEASAAARVVRREVGELEKLQRKAGADFERFRELALEFYGQHPAFVAEAMVLKPDEAIDYCATRIARVPEKAEHVAVWLERLARSGAADLIEIRGACVRAVLRDRERRKGSA